MTPSYALSPPPLHPPLAWVRCGRGCLTSARIRILWARVVLAEVLGDGATGGFVALELL
jgi:hypothetical protein